MAVESFLPINDVKQTVEKEVKRKPSLAELTTIESPGKPTPATFLENGKDEAKKPRKKRAKTEKTDEFKVIEPEKDSILIITEKPQAAMKIASALGKPYKYGDDGVSYYEVNRNGKNILVASAVGHLYNITYKKGQKGWPIFDIEWVPSHLQKHAAFTKKYLELIRKLSKRAKEIIIATDFDNEGEVIGWNVLRFICKKQNAKRMKYSTLTAPELEKAFENPLKELAWGNAYAGETRHILDWLYGINLSRALMSAIKTTGSFKILSIGRVQGPALKIIVDREREISNFKPVPFYRISALSNNLEFFHPEDIFEEENLKKFENINEAIAETKKTEESILPPHPFDLTTLQREAYRWHKISPSDTLKAAQKLYLDGLISYPRTSSQKIPKEIEPKKILKALEKRFPEVKDATRPFPIEGKKSDPAHPSIYPTGEPAGKLAGNEEKIYLLIAKRFISCFSQDAKTANKKITLTAIDKKGKTLTYEQKINPNDDSINNDKDSSDENKSEDDEARKNNSSTSKTITIKFIASGLKVLERGWARVYPMKFDEIELPDLNGKVKIDEIVKKKMETQPPKRYSPASLITTLERKNLGTKATRSSIVDTLFDRGYLDGTSIKATQLGLRLIETLEKYSPIIIDENLTRQLEEQTEKIQELTQFHEKEELEVIEKAKRLITDISKEFKIQESKIGQEIMKGIEQARAEERESNTLMPCTTCNKGNLRILYSKKTRRFFIACSNYPECKQTYSLPPNALIKKSGTNCPADNFPKLLAIRKGKRPWEFCFNPNCPVEKEKREKWQAKKASNEQN